MCAAKHNRRVLQQIIGCERIPQILLHARGNELPALGELNEARQRKKVDKSVHIIRRDETVQLLTIYGNGGRCHEHTSLRVLLKSLFDRRFHPYDRNIIESPHLIHGNRGCRIARDNDGIRLLLFDEKLERRANIAAYSGNGLRSIGYMIAIGKEQELLGRKRTPCVTEHRQPANPRIKQRNAHTAISFSATNHTCLL